MKAYRKSIFYLFVLAGIFFVTTASTPPNNLDEDRNNKILHTIGIILKQVHYKPQVLNDEFSEKIFNEFIKSMDREKNIFLETDIKELKKYSSKIDDEIIGAPIEFFYVANDIYKKRLEYARDKHLPLLEKPFSFSDKDSIITVYEQRNFPKNEKEQTKLWAKELKFRTLEKFVELQNQRENSKVDSIINKTDKDLELQARNSTKTIMAKSFDRMIRKTSDNDRFSLFVNTITNLMDPHTDYFAPIEKRAWDEGITGKFYGIGAQIGQENGYVKIAVVSQGGPAWKSGEVNDGDLILKIGEGNNDPVDVAGYDIQDAVKLIRGNKGTTVSLTLKKVDGTVKVVQIVREELKLEETFTKSAVIQEGSKKTGYIYLPKFYTSFGDPTGRSCYEDVATELLKLQQEKVDGVVIDLRNNGGGSLQEVVNMVGLFIPDGPVVQVVDSKGKANFLSDRDNGKVLYDGPLVVMINEFSASASEIFAAAIQDYNRGIIVGSSSTYGKGTVQRPIPLSRNSAEEFGSIHLTIQKYYRINGASVQLKGVEPDIVMPGYYEFFKVKEKDNPSALPWDEVGKLTFKRWDKLPKIDFLKNEFQKRNDSTQVFSKIYESSVWIAKQNDAPDYLNIEKYNLLEKQKKEVVTKTRDLLKLKTDMDIKVLDPVTKDSVSTTIKESNTRFLNFLKNDFYLHEAFNVL
ncbi:MAG: carboxy terminal-processing peptidase, partial [Bacteroidota bacterium]